MTEAMQSIIGWYQTYYADGFYLVMALFSYIYLFAHCPELRKRFLVPMALVMFLVLNPLLYQYVYSDNLIYWRLFWMFPTGILIALAAVTMVKYSKGTVSKGFVLVGICALIVIKGANVYTERGFEPITNAEKVPEEVKEICDIMLELEENPRCIMPETLFCDVRQYSGKIEMMYGRDVQNYIIPNWDVERYAFGLMESETPDYSWILLYANQEDYSFVVTYGDRPIEPEVLSEYGYVRQQYSGNYYIYWRE